MTVGFTFGDSELFRLRKYYREWIDRTLRTALHVAGENTWGIIRFNSCVDPIAIEDEGRLPYSRYQRKGKISNTDSIIACLLVEIRNMIQVWWKCSEETPGDVEQWLVGLDNVIENWDRQKVAGSVGIGYWLETVK